MQPQSYTQGLVYSLCHVYIELVWFATHSIHLTLYSLFLSFYPHAPRPACVCPWTTRARLTTHARIIVIRSSLVYTLWFFFNKIKNKLILCYMFIFITLLLLFAKYNVFFYRLFLKDAKSKLSLSTKKKEEKNWKRDSGQCFRKTSVKKVFLVTLYISLMPQVGFLSIEKVVGGRVCVRVLDANEN